MKAVQLINYGGYENLVFNPEVNEPVLHDDQVLVEVMASSVNPFDTFIVKGYMKDMRPLNLPVTPGSDFSGRIKKVGKNVQNFKEGMEVYGSAIVFGGGSGAYAEMASVNPKRIALKPKSIDFVQAASLPLVGSSAIQALMDTMKLTSGQKILIHGGAGGIGSVAIQLAKYLKAYVATTVSKEDRQFVENLGADEVIDYRTERFEDILKNFDAVYDTIGGEVTNKSFKVLKSGGILASMKGQPDESLAKQFGVIGAAVNTSVNSDRLERLADLIDHSVIKPQVDKVFPLEDTKGAFDYKETNHPNGKIVIKIYE